MAKTVNLNGQHTHYVNNNIFAVLILNVFKILWKLQSNKLHSGSPESMLPG